MVLTRQQRRLQEEARPRSRSPHETVENDRAVRVYPPRRNAISVQSRQVIIPASTVPLRSGPPLFTDDDEPPRIPEHWRRYRQAVPPHSMLVPSHILRGEPRPSTSQPHRPLRRLVYTVPIEPSGQQRPPRVVFSRTSAEQRGATGGPPRSWNQESELGELLSELARRRAILTEESRAAHIERISAYLHPETIRDPAKEARIAQAQAEHAIDNQPQNLRKKYSRGCGVCLTNPNPRVRVVLGECGHFMCEPCVDQLEDRMGAKVRCPFCRKYSGYVRLFEQEEEDGMVQEGGVLDPAS